jgi:hypothetical protein
MADYSDNWRGYLEVEGEVPETLEVLGKFHAHIRSIPIREELPRGERNTGRYGGLDTLLEGYRLDRPEGYREFLENVREGEGFSELETAELYIHLGMELDNLQRVRSTLQNVEDSGATITSIRELSQLTEEAIERKLQEAVQQGT